MWFCEDLTGALSLYTFLLCWRNQVLKPSNLITANRMQKALVLGSRHVAPPAFFKVWRSQELQRICWRLREKADKMSELSLETLEQLTTDYCAYFMPFSTIWYQILSVKLVPICALHEANLRGGERNQKSPTNHLPVKSPVSECLYGC